MFLPSRQALRNSDVRAIALPECSDRTLYDAEELPIRIHMQPHRCASDPRLKLDLRALVSPHSSKQVKLPLKQIDLKPFSPQLPSLPQSPTKADRVKVKEYLRKVGSEVPGSHGSPGTTEKTKPIALCDGGKRRGKALMLSLAVTPLAGKKHTRIPSFKSADSSPHYRDFLRRVGTAAKIGGPQSRSLWSKPRLLLK